MVKNFNHYTYILFIIPALDSNPQSHDSKSCTLTIQPMVVLSRVTLIVHITRMINLSSIGSWVICRAPIDTQLELRNRF